MRMNLHEFDLPLRHTFTIARGSRDRQQTLIVELRDGEHSGYGESPEWKWFGVTAEACRAAAESVRPRIEAMQWEHPSELWEALYPHLRDLPGGMFTLCGIDQAAYDLWGKRQGRPTWKLLGLSIDRNVPSDYTIGIDTIDKMVAKMAEFPGFPVYKIKLGTKEDIAIVRALRQHTDAVLRVDANCGWPPPPETTIAYSHELKNLGVEFIEQPLPAGSWDAMKRVRAESALPIIADEDCMVEADVERCAGAYHGVNIKLSKCGGMTPALRMIRRARELGMSVMCGCMTESTVGISAIAQILPLLDYADMDGALLLGQDVASGARVEQGRVVYPDVNGNGVTLLR